MVSTAGKFPQIPLGASVEGFKMLPLRHLRFVINLERLLVIGSFAGGGANSGGPICHDQLLKMAIEFLPIHETLKAMDCFLYCIVERLQEIAGLCSIECACRLGRL